MNIKEIYTEPEIISIESYLNKNGITDIQEYFNPTDKYLESPMKYKNMLEGVQLFKYHYLQNSTVYILSDSSDLDGITTTVMMYQYIKLLNNDLNVKILIHFGKERGVQDDVLYDKIINEKPNLLIVPDAGSNDKDRVSNIFNNGTDVLVIDHHEIDNPIERGILISNQYNDECDKDGSAGVVVHKFLQALDNEFNVKYSNQFIDLVALSIISDSRNVRSMQNRVYLEYGIMHRENINNKFLSLLFDKFIGDKEYTQKDISFKVVPKCNSVSRTQDQELKQRMIMAFLNEDNLEEVADLCEQAHKNQINTVNEIIDNNISDIDKSNEIIVFTSDCIPRSYSGLIAGKIKSLCENKPTIVGSIKDNCMIGSLRSPIPLKDILNECEYVDWCNGHKDSAGIQIQQSNIQPLIEYLNALKLDYSPHIDVLKSYPIKSIPNYLFGLFEPYMKLFGQGLLLPCFHIHSIIVHSENITMLGANKRTLKWKSQGIDFLIFNCTKKDKENLGLGYYENDKFIEENKKIKFDIEVVGVLQLNRWKNYVTNQCIINNMEIKEYKKKGFSEIW